MNTRDIAETLALLFEELVDGSPKSGGYMLNGGDAGLLGCAQRSWPRRPRLPRRRPGHRLRPTWITFDTVWGY